MAVGQHTIQDLTILLLLLFIQNALHLLNLIRDLCKFAQLRVTKTHLDIIQLDLELENFVRANIYQCLLQIVLQVILQTSLQNRRYVLVSDSFIDLCL